MLIRVTNSDHARILSSLEARRDSCNVTFADTQKAKWRDEAERTERLINWLRKEGSQGE